MKLTTRTLTLNAVIATVVFISFTAQQTSAVLVDFTIDPALSSIMLTGGVAGVGALVEQGPGSLTTSYSGLITVDIDDLLAPSSIETLGSSAVAAISGMWLPEVGGGTDADPGLPADANYGLALDAGVAVLAFAAARDIEFDITGPMEGVAGGSFASSQSFTIASGVFDVWAVPAFGGPSSDDLTGDVLLNMAGPSSYSVSGSTATLTIPVLMDDIDPEGLSVFYEGVIVATATVPEPSSAVLILSMFCGMFTFIRRR